MLLESKSSIHEFPEKEIELSQSSCNPCTNPNNENKTISNAVPRITSGLMF